MKLAVVLVAAALLASACGRGGSKPAATAADVAPLGTYALLSGRSERVRRALELLPQGRRLVRLLGDARMITGGGEQIALLDPSGRTAVAIVRHADTKALDRAGIAHASVRGWTVFSHQAASVEAVRHAKRHLVDAAWYRPAEGDVTFVLPRLTLVATRHGEREVAEQTARGAGVDAEQPLATWVPADAVAAAAFQNGALGVPRASRSARRCSAASGCGSPTWPQRRRAPVSCTPVLRSRCRR